MVSEAVSSTEQRWNLQTHPWRTNIRLLFLSAMTVFTITVGIGIFNGLHITTLSQDVLLTHVHAGTLGWITLSVLASCLWLFGEGQVLTERSFYISLFSAISIPLYVGAFLSLNLLFELIGVVIYIVRFAPRILRINWLKRGPRRFFAFSGIFIVVDILLLVYILGSVIGGIYKDFQSVPVWLVFALDHAVFIGIMSNALFGLIQEASAERRAFWPWADDVLFWGMNFGMVGFVVSLLLDQRILERVFTPIMGLSILVAIVTYVIRLSRPSRAEQVEVSVSPTSGR